MREKKVARETFATTSKIILPNDTNTLGNLMGGQLLNWMDINAAISAQRHCRRVVVTAAVNNVSFNKAIKLGDILTIESKVSRSFGSSMEIFLDVSVEDHRTGKRTKCNEAIYTFVAVDQVGQPINVPQLIPESDVEKERYDGALRRRQLGLILAKKMDPKDATELKALFEN
ncbi:MAG TPA: acyl-CoA thioesterase [Cryomorphaceae bacterium]|nr:acyl-CoA thioesterase [Cryomorphaceae bacterium]